MLNGDNIILLKRGKDSNKNIFFIHDGMGTIGCYFDLCRMLKEEFNIYGITLDERVGYIPIDITIQDLAEKYLRQVIKIQPFGTYSFGGWSLGGTIAYEMARLMESHGGNIKDVIIFDTLPPILQLPDEKKRFSIETEIDILSRYITDEKIIYEMKECKNITKIWTKMEECLCEDNFRMELFLQENSIFAVYFEKGTNNSLRRILEIYNTIRTLYVARNKYNPGIKSDFDLMVFYSQETGLDKVKDWNRYSIKIQFCEVNGNHNTILDGLNTFFIADKLNVWLS